MTWYEFAATAATLLLMLIYCVHLATTLRRTRRELEDYRAMLRDARRDIARLERGNLEMTRLLPAMRATIWHPMFDSEES